MRKTHIFINEPVYIGLAILELKENVNNFKNQLTYFFCDNIWLGNFLLYCQTCFSRRICEFYLFSYSAIFKDCDLSRLSQAFKSTSL